MRIVVHQSKIFKLEVENIFDIRIDNHAGQTARLASQLLLHLLKVVVIDMSITQCMHKIAKLISTNFCYHHCEQSIRGNVERNTQKYIGASLVKLARELIVSYIELEQRVARRQGGKAILST